MPSPRLAVVERSEPLLVEMGGLCLLLGGVSRTQAYAIMRAPENADIAPRPFRLLEKGKAMYDVEDVKRFVRERKARGL